MKQLFILLIFFSVAYSEMRYQDDIDVEEAFELFKNGAIIIDVRTPSEFIHTGHGLGHINIPILYQEYRSKSIKIITNFAKMEREKGKGFNSKKLYKIKIHENDNFFQDVITVVSGNLDRDIILICHSGERSKYSANLLAKKGFENIYSLDGGFLAWQKSGYPWSID